MTWAVEMLWGVTNTSPSLWILVALLFIWAMYLTIWKRLS